MKLENKYVPFATVREEAISLIRIQASKAIDLSYTYDDGTNDQLVQNLRAIADELSKIVNEIEEKIEVVND